MVCAGFPILIFESVIPSNPNPSPKTRKSRDGARDVCVWEVGGGESSALTSDDFFLEIGILQSVEDFFKEFSKEFLKFRARL